LRRPDRAANKVPDMGDLPAASISVRIKDPAQSRPTGAIPIVNLIPQAAWNC